MLEHSSAPTLTAYVGLGANLGDRAGNLLLAVRGMLDAGLTVTRLSSIYETEPVDTLTATSQPLFLNMVAELSGELPAAEQLLTRLLRIESALGRRRVDKNVREARLIDLDLLTYGDAQQHTELLILPHPRLHLRRFVLTPLVELAPDRLHPDLHKTFYQLHTDLTDSSSVKLWHPGKMMNDAG